MSEQIIQASAAVSSTEDVIELPEDKLVKPSLEGEAPRGFFGTIGLHIKLAFEWGWFCFLQTIFFIFTPANPKEGILQFIVRQLMLADSKGNPSWTVTILAYTLAVTGYVTYHATQIAHTMTNVLDPATGAVVKQMSTGYPTEFWYLIIALSVIITNAFNNKSAANQEADTGVEPQGVISKIVSAVTSFKTKS